MTVRRGARLSPSAPVDTRATPVPRARLPPTMTRTDRVYRIEMLLRQRGHLSFRAMQDELEVSPATLKRDLEYLRDRLGAPIEYDRLLNGYRFGRGFGGERHELPGLWFSERELYALLMAHQVLSELDADGVISRHLAPLLERIHQMLGKGGGEADARALLRRVRDSSPARRPVPSRIFELLGEALTRRRRVRMAYLTRRRGEVGEREVSPQRLVHYRSTWYLDAWCHGRERLLRFALDAIQDATLLDVRAKGVPLRQVEAEMDRGYGIYAGAEPYWATLRFSPHAARWVGHEQWHPDQRGRTVDDGSFELELPYTDPTELAMDVLRHAGDVRIVADTGPLRELVRRRTREAWELHAAEEGAAKNPSP
jgi:predicted DNA-binding transcriptional regulator YafY